MIAVILVGIFGVLGLVMYSLCAMSSRLSREEEQNCKPWC